VLITTAEAQCQPPSRNQETTGAEVATAEAMGPTDKPNQVMMPEKLFRQTVMVMEDKTTSRATNQYQ